MQTDAIFSALPSTWRDYLGESMLGSIAAKCSPRLLEEASYPRYGGCEHAHSTLEIAVWQLPGTQVEEPQALEAVGDIIVGKFTNAVPADAQLLHVVQS